MDLKLSGKVVLVTGASKGIGKAIALGFARENATVYLASRTESILKETTEEIKKISGNNKVSFITTDVKEAKQIDELVMEIVDKSGSIDILINNAGGPKAGNFLAMAETDWYQAFEQNLLSVVRMSQKVIPLMIENGGGHIINVTSSSIKASIDNLVLSNVMRPGVHGLTKSLAREFADDDILVNTVGPGKIETDRMLELNKGIALKTGKSLEDVKKEIVAEIPMGRYGSPEEFANLVVFLASSANTYITGQAILVEGGAIATL